jgi:two-component system response regulator FixJ
MQNDTPTVYVVDDDNAMKESLSWVMESVGLRVQSYANAQSFLEDYQPEHSGCLLLDVRMPGMTGPELQIRLRKHHIDIPIIFLSAHGDIPLAVKAMKNGAIDFLTKPCNDQVLLENINKALKVDAKRRERSVVSSKVKDKIDRLTPREYQVMCQITTGKLNKIISADLNISLKTVEAHRASVMRKMGVRSLPELVELTIKHKLCDQACATSVV